MATLTIRGLDDDTKARLRVRAARHRRSMEAEVRSILDGALPLNTHRAVSAVASTPASRTLVARSWICSDAVRCHGRRACRRDPARHERPFRAIRPEPDERVTQLLDSLDAAAVATTAITAAELLYGVARLPAGHARSD